MARSKKQEALDRMETAKAELAAKVYEKKLEILNRYDAVDDENSKKRRQPKIEVKGEDDQLSTIKRWKSASFGRDLERNHPETKTQIRQFKTQAVGVGPKLSMQTEDEEFNTDANFLFNSVWAKDCDQRDDTPHAELVANELATIKREGDFVVAFDDFNLDDGKLIYWESDQFTSVKKKDWKTQTDWVNNDGSPMTQENGVIYDKLGIIRGYILTNERAKVNLPYKDVTTLKRGVAKHIKAPWRLNQRRGIADILTPANYYQDAYEILSKELQSAKVAASFAGVVNEKDGIDDYDGLVEGASTTTSGETSTAPNYENLEALVGGYMEYLKDGDDFKILDFNRPNIHLAEFLEYVGRTSGASLGLTKTFSSLMTASAYTAFRGDMLIAWVQFKVDQKFLERRSLDWKAEKVLTWGKRKGKISRTFPKNWQYKMSWEWPEMPQVDELKHENSVAQGLKNGTQDFKKLLGPNWKQKLQSFADQLELIRSLNIPLSMFETKSGGKI